MMYLFMGIAIMVLWNFIRAMSSIEDEANQLSDRLRDLM